MKGVRIRELAEVNPPTPQFAVLAPDTDVTFMPLETVWADDRLDISRRRPKSEVESGYARFREGDILVPKVTPTFQAGRSTLITGLGTLVGAATSEVHVVRPRSGIDPRWVAYAFHTAPFLDEGVSTFQGVAGLQRVPDMFVRDFRLADKTLDDQRRISDFLDDQVARLNAAIRLREEQVSALAQHLASVARSEVIGEAARHRSRTPLGWADTIPSNWTTARLSTIARLGTGHTPSRSVPAYWEDCDIPWLTTTDVKHLRSDEVERLRDTEVHISSLGLANSAAVMHPAGSVGLCRTSASAGYSAVMDVPMACSQDFAVWHPSPLLVPEYLLWSLRVMRSDLLDRLAYGSTHKTIYFPDLEGIRIVLPPLEAQQQASARISQKVAQVRSVRSEMRAQIGLLHERKRSLITAAVTGQFDVSTARKVTA